VGFQQPGEALAEDVLRAARVEAAEAADDEAKCDGAIVSREVGDGAAVAAVDAVLWRAAARAGGGGRGGGEQGDGRVRGQDEIIEA
jgi:hypothetical protein